MRVDLRLQWMQRRDDGITQRRFLSLIDQQHHRIVFLEFGGGGMLGRSFVGAYLSALPLFRCGRRGLTPSRKRWNGGEYEKDRDETSAHA